GHAIEPQLPASPGRGRAKGAAINGEKRRTGQQAAGCGQHFMSRDFRHYLLQCKQRIDEVLPQLLQNIGSEYADNDAQQELQTLFDASLYSVTNGGKRVRASLVY